MADRLTGLLGSPNTERTPVGLFGDSVREGARDFEVTLRDIQVADGDVRNGADAVAFGGRRKVKGHFRKLARFETKRIFKGKLTLLDTALCCVISLMHFNLAGCSEQVSQKRERLG